MEKSQEQNKKYMNPVQNCGSSRNSFIKSWWQETGIDHFVL